MYTVKSLITDPLKSGLPLYSGMIQRIGECAFIVSFSLVPRPQKTVRVLYRGSGNETKSVSVLFPDPRRLCVYCTEGLGMRLSQFLSSFVNRVLFPDRLLHVIRSASRKEVWALKLLNGMIVSGQERVGREHMCAHVSPTHNNQIVNHCMCVHV